MRSMILCCLLVWTNAAHAMDPNINFGALIHDAFALQYKSAKELYPSFRERLEILESIPFDQKIATVNLKSGGLAKGEWATCGDFAVMSRREYKELRSKNPQLDYPSFFHVSNPVALSLYYSTNFRMRITEFEAVVAVADRHFEVAKIIDPDASFFSEEIIRRLSEIKSRHYTLLFDFGLQDPWRSPMRISVSKMLQCNHNIELFFISGGR